MKVRFSRLAVYKLEKLSAYLVSEWSERSKYLFLQTLDSKIKAIEANPQLYPKSEFEPSLRKCVVTRQTTLLYEIQTDAIFVITIADTRQNQKNIIAEIKQHFASIIKQIRKP